MAAAEYFNPNVSMAHTAPPPPPPAQQGLSHYAPQQPPRPNPPQNNLNLPYPISDAPPPYSEQARPQSQPPPSHRPSVHFPNQPATYQQYRPNQPVIPNVDTHQYPPEKMPAPQRPPNNYRPSDYTSSHPPTLPPQQYGGPTAVAPGLSQVYSNQQWQPQRPSSSSQDPHRRSSRSRSRSRERRRRHQHKQKPRDKNMSTFLGASGGAVIGDLIFPGLGTLGGALLGGVGGKLLKV